MALNFDYDEADFIYLSLGAGVQSTALYVLSSLEMRDVPRADVAIFADTQDEPPWVYENMERLLAWQEHNGGVPIDVVTIGRLGDHLTGAAGAAAGQRFVSIPAFTRNNDGRAGPLRRQCTREYKITPIEKRVRELMGFKPRQRIKGKAMAAALVGISLDEVQRMSTSRTPWVTTCYPLVDARIHRAECYGIAEEYGLEAPRKSSCIFCPYHSDAFWKMLRDNHPAEWRRACEVDEAIRNMTRAGVENPAYLHRTLKPLDSIEFDEQDPLFDAESGDCGGHCGT